MVGEPQGAAVSQMGSLRAVLHLAGSLLHHRQSLANRHAGLEGGALRPGVAQRLLACSREKRQPL